jgi:hypothetical protein
VPGAAGLRINFFQIISNKYKLNPQADDNGRQTGTAIAHIGFRSNSQHSQDTMHNMPSRATVSDLLQLEYHNIESRFSDAGGIANLSG